MIPSSRVTRLLRTTWGRHRGHQISEGAHVVAFAGAERFLRLSQGPLNRRCERVRAAEYAPRDPCRVLERRHGLAEIVESGAL